MILKGIWATGKKPVNWNKIKEINQEATETLWHFYSALGNASESDPESLQGNAILRSYFISQTAPDIGYKLQKLEIEPDHLYFLPGQGCLPGV